VLFRSVAWKGALYFTARIRYTPETPVQRRLLRTDGTTVTEADALGAAVDPKVGQLTPLDECLLFVMDDAVLGHQICVLTTDADGTHRRQFMPALLSLPFPKALANVETASLVGD